MCITREVIIGHRVSLSLNICINPTVSSESPSPEPFASVNRLSNSVSMSSVFRKKVSALNLLEKYFRKLHDFC